MSSMKLSGMSNSENMECIKKIVVLLQTDINFCHMPDTASKPLKFVLITYTSEFPLLDEHGLKTDTFSNRQFNKNIKFIVVSSNMVNNFSTNVPPERNIFLIVPYEE